MRAGDRSCLSYNLQVFNRKGKKTCRYLKANRTLICWLLNRKTFFKGRLSKMLGHKKISTTEIYAKVLQQDVAAGFNLLKEKCLNKNQFACAVCLIVSFVLEALRAFDLSVQAECGYLH